VKRTATVFAILAMAAPFATGTAWADGRGPAKSAFQCSLTIQQQEIAGITAGGGPKEGQPAPTNCDGNYPPPGQS
jgi:hypothetical protein